MTMVVREFDDLPAGSEAARAALTLTAFQAFPDRTMIEEYRRRGGPLADYVGLFAVDGRRLLGQALVYRFRYRGAGPARMSEGVALVATRPDAARRGVARQILQEFHRRARERGVTDVFLWTNPSWGAHRLYEELGYVDIYSPPYALRSVPRRPRPSRGFAVGPARPAELPRLEGLFRKSVRSARGFVARPARFLRTEVGLGRFDVSTILVARTEDRPVGYAIFRRHRSTVTCGELVAPDAPVRAALIDAVTERAAGAVCGFCLSSVAASDRILTQRGFDTRVPEWLTLMGSRLGERMSPEEAIARFATRDPSFSCMVGDGF
ncbi:MAG: GNAT family N-acetyltransferase [Thermoplasmata archaeon]|nr:GNAT family N-acetyltransferase [Thermoplasmata archaeon]